MDCNKFTNQQIDNIYDPETGVCVLECRSEGRFDDPDDFKASYKTYIECIYDRKKGRLVSHRRRCPKHTSFDIGTRLCLHQSSLRRGGPGGLAGADTCARSIYAKLCTKISDGPYYDYLERDPLFRGTRVGCTDYDGFGRVRHRVFKCDARLIQNQNLLAQCDAAHVAGCRYNVTRVIEGQSLVTVFAKYMVVYDCTDDRRLEDGVEVELVGCPRNQYLNLVEVSSLDGLVPVKDKNKVNFWSQFNKQLEEDDGNKFYKLWR